MNKVTEVDPWSDDLLAQRLRTLHIRTPESALGSSVAGARPRHRLGLRHRVRNLSLCTAGLVAVVAANAVAAYFAPAYASALANAPAIGLITAPALQAAGLSAAAIEPLHDQASSDGVTVTLVGGYIDSLQTTLFLDIEEVAGHGTTPPPVSTEPPYLTDQFGNVYQIIGGEGIDVGPYPSVFQPLRGPAASVGARLTVHIGLSSPATERRVGELDLHAALVAGQDGRRLAIPRAVTVDATTYRIVDMKVSTNSVEVHTVQQGKLIDADVAASNALRPGGSVCYPGVFLVTASGAYEDPIATLNEQTTPERLQKSHLLDETQLFARTASGPFRIVVAGCTNAPPDREPVLASWTINPDA